MIQGQAGRVQRQTGPEPACCTAVPTVADHGVTAGGRVAPDLVGSAGL
jgi:hypothetical protein